MADGLAVGEQAPDVTAPLVRPGGETESVPLEALYDDRPLLLVFYTNDFTPDCVEEWCSFRDYEWFSFDSRLDIVGVSKSRPATHRRFMNRIDLTFPLYADTDLEMSDAFGVTYRVFKLLRRSRRSCFLIDQDGTVRYKWLAEHWLDPTRATPDLDELHDAIEQELGTVESESFGFE